MQQVSNSRRTTTKCSTSPTWSADPLAAIGGSSAPGSHATGRGPISPVHAFIPILSSQTAHLEKHNACVAGFLFTKGPTSKPSYSGSIKRDGVKGGKFGVRR